MLNAQHLRKQYSTVLAVDDVSLQVERGQIFGLIGPNGAGKSSTIRMLLNITRPDSGTITYDGQSFSDTVRNRIGYLPEERGLYKKNGVLDTIVYFASLRGIAPSEAKRRGMEWLERFQLQSYAKRKVEELSKGNQQKAQFITTILHDPDLVILDEPFSGLDPVNQIVMKEIFSELKQKGKAIIFSTHQMESAEKLCDEICLINRGRIVLEGTVKQAKQKFGTNAVHLEFEGDGTFLSSLPFIRTATVYENYAELSLNGAVPSREILSAVGEKLDVRKFEFMEPSLNSIFLEVVGAEVPLEPAPAVVPSGPLPSVLDPQIKKQQLSVILSLLLFVIGTIMYLTHKDTGGLAAIGAITSGIGIYRLQNLKKDRRAKEVSHE